MYSLTCYNKGYTHTPRDMQLIEPNQVTEVLTHDQLTQVWSQILLTSHTCKDPLRPVVKRSVAIALLNQWLSEYHGVPIEVSEYAFNQGIYRISSQAKRIRLTLSIRSQLANRYLRADNGACELVLASWYRWGTNQGVKELLASLTNLENQYIQSQVTLWRSRSKPAKQIWQLC